MTWEDNLTQEGGDRYAETAAIIAVIAEALGTGAEDDEIREAFGMGKWRVVTEAHRLRYGEYFAERTYWALIHAMRDGVNSGRLSIRDFVTIEKGEPPAGELFPVTTWGPCIEANMVFADVKISAGDDDSLETQAEYEGRYEQWKNGIVGGVIQGFPEQYQVIDEAAGLFVVPGKITMQIDYGGLFQQSRAVVNGLCVRGRMEKRESPAGGAADYYALVVEDAWPDVPGPVPWIGGANVGFGGPLQAWELGRPYFNPPSYPSRVFSLAQIEAMAGKMAESVLTPAAVHSLDPENMPLSIAAWANCFPRQKWVASDAGGAVTHWAAVQWITRAEWFRLYGGVYDEVLDAGGVVPGELIGDSVPGRRFYAKFAQAFIEELNAIETVI